MNQVVVIGCCAALLAAGCEKAEEVSVAETRPVASCDAPPRLDAASDERFDNAPRPRFKAETPEDWKVLPASELRRLNYRFGPSGTGEVWVSVSAGTVPDNVNRWRRQFGQEPLDEVAVKALPAAILLEKPGVMVRLEGTYSPGMGAPPKPDSALAGIIAEVDGEIITIKMVATPQEVRFALPALMQLAAGLRKLN